jgi:hypothetical protein
LAVHEDFSRQHHVKPGSDRSFGLVMAAAFTVFGLAPMRHGTVPRGWALLTAAVLLAVSLAAPRVLRPLNLWWTRFGLLLNRITSPVLLGAVFFLGVMPTGWVMRAMGRDPMRRTRDPQATSYWIRREKGPGSMTRQF